MITNVRILFIDDEPAVLRAIERQLHRDRARWEMVFAVGGQRGLDEIRNRCFTVVVSDFRMPQVDGIAVLNEAAAACPGMVPIMLSGDAEAAAVSRAVPSLRQLLAKPCDTATLREAIERAVAAAPRGSMRGAMTSPRVAAAGSPIACSRDQAQLAAGDGRSLVTAPDEQERCCVIIGNERCDHATAYRVSGNDGALDDYTYVCKCHVELVRGLDDAVAFIAS